MNENVTIINQIIDSLQQISVKGYDDCVRIVAITNTLRKMGQDFSAQTTEEG